MPCITRCAVLSSEKQTTFPISDDILLPTLPLPRSSWLLASAWLPARIKPQLDW